MWKLALRSAIVMAILFGLVFAVGMAAIYRADLPIWAAIGFAVFVVGLQYLFAPAIIGWIYKIRWVDPWEVDAELAEFIKSACADRKIPFPRFGIIEDGNPNAFTFGHYPGNARVVVTRGLIDILSQRERQAVVAHELGHIKHWDFVVMTIAGLVPLILYIVYMWTRDRDDRLSGQVAIGAFLAYMVSQFIVLLLSRIREYFADDFAAEVTGDPGSLSLALVKISYGITRNKKPSDKEEGLQKKGLLSRFKSGKKRRRAPVFNKALALAPLGISSEKGSSGSVLGGIGPDKKFDAGAMAAAMEWDLFNPWAFLYQLSSTHPLTALRVRAMNRKARHTGKPELMSFPESPRENLRPTFLADLAIWALPLIALMLAGIGAGLTVRMFPQASPMIPGLVLLLLGVSLVARLRYRYSSDYSPRTVTSLLRELKVSKIRPVPVKMRGTIIGKGVPGLFWSEDLVLRDETGFIILDYRQPIRLLDFIFGLRKAEKFIGKDATVTGWYRRGLRPYVELYKLEAGDLKGRTFVYPMKVAMAYVAVIAGFLWTVSGIANFIL